MGGAGEEKGSGDGELAAQAGRVVLRQALGPVPSECLFSFRGRAISRYVAPQRAPSRLAALRDEAPLCLPCQEGAQPRPGAAQPHCGDAGPCLSQPKLWCLCRCRRVPRGYPTGGHDPTVSEQG